MDTHHYSDLSIAPKDESDELAQSSPLLDRESITIPTLRYGKRNSDWLYLVRDVF
jgi:hypothetical protein